MLLLVVWIVVAVIAVVVLGALLYSLVGAAQRLRREVEAAQREAGPVLAELQAALAAADARQRSRGNGEPPTRGIGTAPPPA